MLTYRISRSYERLQRLLAAATSLLVIGCGGSNRSNGGDDAGAGPDAGASDAAMADAASDAAMVDAASDAGTPLLFPGHYTIESGMSDGHFLIRDQARAASAADEATGALHAIVDDATLLVGFGNVAFVWSNTNNARLHVWTAAGGARQIASAATTTVAASADGRYVAYYDNHQGDLADLYLNRTDVDEPHKLLTGTHVDRGCAPKLGFVASRLIASHCDGANAAAITSWNLTDQSHLDLLAQGFSRWESDKAETRVFVLALDHHGGVVTPTDAALVAIDSDIESAAFTADGTALLYCTTAGGAFRKAAGGGTPTTLQTTGVNSFSAVSPDARAFLFTSGFDAQRVLSDLKLTSAVQNDAVVTLNPAQTSGFMGPGFTADSRYAVYGQGIDPTVFVGSMYAVPAAGGALRLIAAAVNIWYSIGGAKLVFDDHFTPGGPQGTADIEALDLDVVGATPRLLATQVNGVFLVTKDKSAVIYAAETGPSGPGVYRRALP